MSTLTHPETTEETLKSDDVIRHHESIRNAISVITALAVMLFSSISIVYLIARNLG